MSKIGGVGAQMALIAGLRWRILRNSLGTWKARWELIAHVALGALAGLISVGIGVAAGAVAHVIVLKGRLDLFALLTWGILGFWQVFPLLVAVSTPEFDFHNLLRFPLRFQTFFLLTLLYGLFDPVAVAAMFWLGCILTGIAFARPEFAIPAAAILILFAALNLLLGRLVFSWLARLLARRRTREVMFVLIMLGLLSVQLLAPLLGPERRNVDWTPVVNASRVLPPGAAAGALESVARGQPATAAMFAGLVTAYAVWFGILLRRRVAAQYRGEEFGEAERVAEATSGLVVSPGWHVPGLRAPVAAVFEKEMLYLVRNGPAMMIFVVPLMLILFVALVPRDSARTPALLRGSTELWFPSGVAYALMIIAPMAWNSFAYEGRGVQALLMAPVKFRDVLAGKNLALGLMLCVETAAVWLIISSFVAPPALVTLTATLAALLFALTMFLTIGNALSLIFPRRFDFGGFRQRQSGVSVLIGLVVQFVIMCIAGIVFTATRWLEKPWWGPLIFLCLAAAAYQVYLFGLAECDRLARGRQEALTSELCHD